ncbi:hypothetical protein Dimus_029265 [Dionaea muscipula]
MAGETQYYVGGPVLVEGKDHRTMGGGGGGGAPAGGFGRGGMATMALRALAMVLTLAAAVTLGLDKQTKMVTVNVGTIGLSTPVTAKSTYLSAFKYFVVANAIAAIFAAFSLVFSIANSGKKVSGLVAACNIIIVALLYSAIGAAGAIGLIGLEGNDHLKWHKVCNVFDKFCDVGLVALILSFLGSITYVLLIFHSISPLH